ncbi:MAG: acyl-CoA dehydrogenase family protein [Deltaproteobacteria bacterium]|nr:acyl-CoA dehydrogenase family protein [Deltaproteobacteria bacterium]
MHLNDELEEEKIIRESARRFVQREVKPLADEMEEKQYFPRELLKKTGEAGFIAPFITEEYGGGGGTYIHYAIIHEEIAKVSPGYAMSVTGTGLLFGHNVFKAGLPQQKEKYLLPICSGEKIGCWALTEPNIGSDALSIETTYRKQGDEYVINGSKTFITNAPVADLFLIFTKHEDYKGKKGMKGGTAFILERGIEGLSLGNSLKKLGMNASPTGEIFLEDVVVGRDQIMGEEGMAFFYMMNNLDIERALGAPTSIGIAQACLDISVEYSKQRVQFGKPIAEHQMIREKIAEMATGVDLARVYTYHILRLAQSGHKIVKEAAISKYFASTIGTRSALEAIQIMGGYGYMKDYFVERFLRDAKLMEIGAGTNEIQKLIISREALR